MSQIGRRRPNVSVLLRTVVPKTYLIEQVGDATASATISATRADVAEVAGVTTAGSTLSADGILFANLTGVAAAGTEASASQAQVANVLGTVVVIATSAFEREDLTSVNGVATANAVVLAQFFRPEQRIRRSPEGRY
jgi:hypothetical protein